LRTQFALDRCDEKKESEKCPGEVNCGMFKIAFRETGNGLDACKPCSMLPTKPDPKGESQEPEDEHDLFFAAVFDARARLKLSGHFGEMTTLQFEMSVAADQLIEIFERESSARARVAQEDNLRLITEIMKALGGIKTK
jgi:hypothetical protein